MECYYIKYMRFNESLNEGFGFTNPFKIDEALLASIKFYIQKTVENEKKDFYSYYTISDYAVFTYSTSEQTHRIDSEIRIGIINILMDIEQVKFVNNFIAIKNNVFATLLKNYKESFIGQIDYKLPFNLNKKPNYNEDFLIKFAKTIFIASINPTIRLLINYDINDFAPPNNANIESLIYDYVPLPSIIKCGYIGRSKNIPEFSGIKFYFCQESSNVENSYEIKRMEEKDIYLIDFISGRINMPRTNQSYIDRIINGLNDNIIEIHDFIKMLNNVILLNNFFTYFDASKKYYEAVLMYEVNVKNNSIFYPNEIEKSEIVRYLINRNL